MFKVSTKSQYGLRAMVYLAKNRSKVSPISEISKKEGISFDYLEKIISKLEKAELVQSKKGIKGGYVLGKPSSKIKIREIIQALEGNTALVKCVSGNRSACLMSKKCCARSLWKKLQDSLNLTLSSVTLADLIK